MSLLRSHGARSALLVLAAGTALAVTTASGASAAGAAVDGNAYGAEVNATTLGLLSVTVGPTPSVTLPSTGSATPLSQTLASVSAAGLLSTGVLQVSTVGTPGSDVESNAQVAGVDVPTVLTADVIGASCEAAADGTLSGSSVLTNLSIGGVAVSADAAPNTVIQLGGLATVTVNEQTEIGVGTADPQIVVNAIDIKLLPGLASIGTGQIVIGHAECSQEGESVSAPVGAIGGVLLTGAVGAVFTVRQLRRRGGASA
jgi:hypothetical protein